ncbi:MAG: EAL domain-containing protein [Terracidiphilus sp.]|jgi:diguanylate cyclase (GGDEF)-like protein/PAS domain S-box-containing protein
MKRRAVKTVLLIQDDVEETRLMQEMFRDQGSDNFTLTHAQSMADAEAYLRGKSIAVVLLDLGCIDAPGIDAVKRVRAAAPGASIVLLTRLEDEALAMRMMEEGVQDYLMKDQIEPHELMRAMRNSVARKILEETLFNEKSRAQITLECIGDAVICTDLAGNISFLNPVAERMTGWSLREATGRPLADSFRIMDASTGEVAADPTAQAIQHGRLAHLPVNCILTRRDGHQIFIEDSVAPIHDGSGLAAGSVLVFRDVTATRALAEQIAHLAEHDSLTGLPNRLLLNDRLNQAIARAGRKLTSLAIIFLDLDNFKHINDSLGHPTGDQLLKSVAERLEGCVRTPDTVSRQGGDEFVLLLQDVQRAEDAAITARRILRVLREAHLIDGHELQITASIGISVYPDDGLDEATLMKNADTAMYQAKEGGRQNFRFFKPEMNIRAVERQSMEEDLRGALERNELTLQYQPIVNLESGMITGAEALLRWTSGTRGLVPPAQFIPVAEDSGLILPIGAWVLREACMQAKTWIDAGMRPITMSVNVSPLQFRTEEFLNDLVAILDESGLVPDSLRIELTEGGLMERAKFGTPTLQALRQIGVQVAVDDFGTGYSSLSYLRKLRVDTLKIDQSFVREITAPLGDTTIVSAIISMGRSLKLRVIAEGVESADDLAFLKSQNCDEAQGFYFSRPVSSEQFASLLEHPDSAFGRYKMSTLAKERESRAMRNAGRSTEGFLPDLEHTVLQNPKAESHIT